MIFLTIQVWIMKGNSSIFSNNVLVRYISMMLLRKRYIKPEVVDDRISKVCVIGSGLMGSSIARFFALKKIPVKLKVRRKTEATINRLLEKGAAYGNSRKKSHAEVKKYVEVTESYDMDDCDLVIEAVPENIRIKKSVFRKIEGRAIAASNTSSIPVAALAGSYRYPSNFLGLHFFYPADSRPIVEVVAGKKTGEKTTKAMMHLLHKLGKMPIRVNDGPGFLISRINAFYLSEALRCLQDGLGIEKADMMMKRFGMLAGPFQMMDLLGSRLCADVAENLSRMPRFKNVKLLKKMAQGNISFFIQGRENKAVYRLIKRRKGGDYLERMILTIVNESARCIEEGIIDDAQMLDIAMVFGMGFSPATMGPMRFADRTGLGQIVMRLGALERKYGSRFECCRLLRDMARKEKKFYAYRNINK